MYIIIIFLKIMLANETINKQRKEQKERQKDETPY